jgi:phosphonopyruvate decarboxylase
MIFMEKPENRNCLITSKSFFSYFKNNGIDFFTGVPDSILGSFCLYLNDHLNNEEHVVAANEGGAIALAIGYHLASKKIPLVYMQNSGLGNALNPLVSLASITIFYKTRQKL